MLTRCTARGLPSARGLAAVAERRRAAEFLQLFDGDAPDGGGSSTYTYILADGGAAVIIDPVLEQVDRDLAALSASGLTLTLAVNTHCHADHITGTGELKRRLPGLRSAIARAAGAKADVLLEAGEEIGFGQRRLRVLETPGHTDGCLSFYDPSLGAVFTGDALLIGGCGRTDFQGGSSERLYRSVHEQLFTLPDETTVYPAHGSRRGTLFSYSEWYSRGHVFGRYPPLYSSPLVSTQCSGEAVFIPTAGTRLQGEAELHHRRREGRHE
uniref:Metallo-beta-lactamase domain-containing protein n=1 Tax=Emiliania huxleyi TaxID=2903 RepID=A0A7S3TRI1_EMIHU